MSLGTVKIPTLAQLGEAAAELGETLAMSNLASRYLAGGFIEDAHRLLNQGRTADNPHPNIGSGLAITPTYRPRPSVRARSEARRGRRGLLAPFTGE